MFRIREDIRQSWSMTPLRLAQQCQWHHYVMFIGIKDTAVQIWHRCDFIPNIWEALATFTGEFYRKSYIGKLFYTLSITFTQHKNMGVIYSKDRFGPSGAFLVDLLREFEAIFKKDLTPLSGA
jgi:hypothetical protein